MNAPEAERWLAYAHSALDAGLALLRAQDHYPRQACFLAQQAAEKALKAILVLLEANFPSPTISTVCVICCQRVGV
jgi:HEPN domain-containing protein